MNKSEIQIGNYINYEQTTHQVDELHSDKVIHHWLKSGSDGYVTSYEQISPIEISDEELTKFGFERFKKKDSLVSSELLDYWEKRYGEVDEIGVRPAFIIWTDRKVSYFSMKSLNKHTDKKFKYVHELQQLFKLHSDRDLVYEDK
jgi:hypothetical protein